VGLKNGTLRALLFHDRGFGSNNALAGEDKQKAVLANAGAGVRFNLDKSVALRLDVARVLAAGPTTRDGDYRVQASLYFGF
jgi:hemolysin activation/secretion protein